MGKVKFERSNEQPQDAVEAANVTDDDAGDAPGQATALVRPGSMALGAVGGEVSARDIPIPRLYIAYGVGSLAGTFHPGALVLDKEHLLVEMKQPIGMVILMANFYWKEYLNSELRSSGIVPRTFKTEQEVWDNGGTTDWGEEGVGPTFSKAVALLILLAKPANARCSYFNLRIGDIDWAIARWNVDKSAYKRKGGRGVGPDILKAEKYVLNSRTDLPENTRLIAGRWELSTDIEVINGNNTVVPNIRLVGQNDAAFIEELKKQVIL